MNDKPVILVGLVLFLSLAAFPVWYTFGATALFSADPSPPDLVAPEGALVFSVTWSGDTPLLDDLRGRFEENGLAALSADAVLTADTATDRWHVVDGQRRYLVLKDQDHGTLQVYDGCVEDIDYMRANHMVLLLEWRDAVVRYSDNSTVAVNGRPYAKSLNGTCLECHTDREAFCYRCHEYVNTLPAWPARNTASGQEGIRCWNCHLQPNEEANDG